MSWRVSVPKSRKPRSDNLKTLVFFIRSTRQFFKAFKIASKAVVMVQLLQIYVRLVIENGSSNQSSVLPALISWTMDISKVSTKINTRRTLISKVKCFTIALRRSNTKSHLILNSVNMFGKPLAAAWECFQEPGGLCSRMELWPKRL